MKYVRFETYFAQVYSKKFQEHKVKLDPRVLPELLVPKEHPDLQDFLDSRECRYVRLFVQFQSYILKNNAV